MPQVIKLPSIVKAAGNKEKIIREYFGMVNSAQKDISIAWMQSPQGWKEPGQTPDFDEYTLVLKGALTIETKNETIMLKAGEAIKTEKGEWIRYSTPEADTEYVAICLPAFTPETVHRDN